MRQEEGKGLLSLTVLFISQNLSDLILPENYANTDGYIKESMPKTG